MAILKFRPPGVLKGRWWRPEWRVQVELAEWLDKHPELQSSYFHVPNGGFRRQRTSYWLRKSGAKPGVPDIIIIRPGVYQSRQFAMIGLELKRARSYKVSASQKHWLSTLDSYGHLAVVCRGLDAAKDFLNEAYPSGAPAALICASREERYAFIEACFRSAIFAGYSNTRIALYAGVHRSTVDMMRRRYLSALTTESEALSA